MRLLLYCSHIMLVLTPLRGFAANFYVNPQYD